MGRRYNSRPAWESEFNDKPVEGVDTVDKLFFETPKVVTIGKPIVQTYGNSSYGQSSSSSSGSQYNAVIDSSVVRLKSSRMALICGSPSQPKEVAYELSEHPSFDQVSEYLRSWAMLGMGKGAIVARKYCNDWRRTNCTEWGIVTYTVPQPGHQSGAFPGPYNIRWFDPSPNIPATERAWAEDLILIHPCLSDDMLKKIIEGQLEE